MGFQTSDQRGNEGFEGIEVLTCKERIEIFRPKGRAFQRAQELLFGKTANDNISATFDDVRQVLRVSKSGEAVTEIPYARINYTELHGSRELHIKYEGGEFPLVGLYSRNQGRRVLSKLRQATMVPVII